MKDNPKFIEEYSEDFFNIDPFEEFKNFLKIFKEIGKNSDVTDAEYSWGDTVIITFDIYGLNKLDLLIKLSELKYFYYKEYKFKIITNLKEDYIALSEDKEIKIKDIKKKSSANKKKDRPSPSESATKFKVGTKKKGNDGNMWIIVENKNGVKRWSKNK